MAEEAAKSNQGDVLRMAVDIVAAYVSNNTVPAGQVPEVINTVYTSLNSLEGGAEAAPEPAKPAVKRGRASKDTDSDLSDNDAITLPGLEKLFDQFKVDLLKEIDTALKGIDEGTYGICEECSSEIPEARLIALPTTTLCLNCQASHEKKSGW